jgi:hypothetical protein
MALNPDALNLNYDSDDSMQVDSENEQVNNHHTSVDNVQDPDADADGDAEDVDDSTSLAIAGPSSYTPKGSVSLTCHMLEFPILFKIIYIFKGCRRVGMLSIISFPSEIIDHCTQGVRR